MKPNFSGEYVLNRSASVLSAGASSIATAVLGIEHDEPRFRCSGKFATTANAFEFTFELFTDGREGSTCHWQEDALITEFRIGTPEAPAVMTWRYELTDAGSRLRATERIRGGGRDQDNVWEFRREEVLEGTTE